MLETPYGRQIGTETDSGRLDNIEMLLRLTLLSGTNLPVTQIATALSGSNAKVDNQYVEIYKNNFSRLIACRVAADFVTGAGQSLSISLTTDLSNFGRIDVLTEAVKDKSDTIWLKPDQSLYVKNADTLVPLTGANFRVLLFDPLSFATYLNSGV